MDPRDGGCKLDKACFEIPVDAATFNVHHEPPACQEFSHQHPLGGVQNYMVPTQIIPLVARFPLKAGLRRETHEKIRRAQDLLSHVFPSGDVDEVLARALDLLITKLEMRKCGH